MKFLNFFLLIIFCPVLHGQSTYAIDYLGVEQGLSNNSVSSIYRDHLGFMWFGTYDGLNRYDGYDFKIFRHKKNDSASISSNWVRNIIEDSQKRLWIATRNGLNVYNPLQQNFKLVSFYSPDEKKVMPLSGSIGNIISNKNGDVFIASEIYGLLVCRNGSIIAKQIPIREKNGTQFNYFASSITFTDNNSLYVIVREKGIYKYDERKNELTSINTQPKNSLCIKADNQNNLWIGCDDGLLKYNLTNNALQRIYTSNNRIVQLTISNKLLWIASDGDGVLLKNIDSGNVYSMIQPNSPSQISSEAVFSIYHDSENRTWIGTLRDGINIIDGKKNQFTSLTHSIINLNSLVNNFTLSCAEDSEHNVWIGTDGGGLSYLNRQTNRFTNYIYSSANKNSISNNFITTILNDGQNNTWFGTWGGGINRFNKQTNGFEHFTCFNTSTQHEDKNPWCLYEDKEKNIWAGTCLNGALYKLNNQRNQFEVFDTSLRNILVLYEDRESNFWGGNYTTLYKIDKLQKRNIAYNLNFVIRSIYEDENKNFWIGTEGEGLLLFNRKTGTYISYTEENGLSNNAVLKIIPDDKGNLWLSTFKGISVLNINTKSFNNIYQSDGMLSNQLSYNAA